MANDVVDLRSKFELMRRLRLGGKIDEAEAVFRTVKESDFPPDLGEISMSHGLLCDARGILFYIDHDWYDDHYGPAFIQDVIDALAKLSKSKDRS